LTVPVRITRTNGFLKAYAKLTRDIQDRTDIALTQFYANPRHPSLHFEKYKTYHTIRVDRGRWRIAIRDRGDSHYELVDIDRHDRIDRRYSD
jgi:hypothetical protein